MIQHLLLIVLLCLSPIQLSGQSTPEDKTIEVGTPVPPFFLQSLTGPWQSSKRALNAPRTLLCFIDLLQLDTLQINDLHHVLSDSVSIYLIDTNPYYSIEKRKAIYQSLEVKFPVLFDVKHFLSTAYSVKSNAVWFLVDHNGILLDYDLDFTKDRLYNAVRTAKNKE